eukprot:2577792-Prymnesium_polylepis.1
MKPGAGGACSSSWFEWLPFYPSSVAPSGARSLGAQARVGAPADLPNNGSHQSGGRGAHDKRFSDTASTSHRSGWLMTITYVGWYHMVLIQPPNRPLGAVCCVRNVESVTQAAV